MRPGTWPRSHTCVAGADFESRYDSPLRASHHIAHESLSPEGEETSVCEPLASPSPATLCPSYPQCSCALVHIHPSICPWREQAGGGSSTSALQEEKGGSQRKVNCGGQGGGGGACLW